MLLSVLEELHNCTVTMFTGLLQMAYNIDVGLRKKWFEKNVEEF